MENYLPPDQQNRFKIWRIFFIIIIFLLAGIFLLLHLTINFTNHPLLPIKSPLPQSNYIDLPTEIVITPTPIPLVIIGSATPADILSPSSTPILETDTTGPSSTPIPLENGIHIVQPGETLQTISDTYGIPIAAIRESNRMYGDAILPEQKLFLQWETPWPVIAWNYSLLKDDQADLNLAYYQELEMPEFTLHTLPGTYPSLDPQAIANLVENGKHNAEDIFHVLYPYHFNVYVAGRLFDKPNQYVRGYSFSEDHLFLFLYDGSGDAADQQYLAAHEFTHMYMWNMFGPPSSFLVSEGAAAYSGMQAIANSSHLPLLVFCKAYLLAGNLPAISDLKLSYKGQNLNLINYHAAGCFVGYLVDTYGPEMFGKVYSKGDFAAVYGKNLQDLENEWHTWLGQQKLSLPFEPDELVSTVNDLESANLLFFPNFFPSKDKIAAYYQIDQARLAFLEGHLKESGEYLDNFRKILKLAR